MRCAVPPYACWLPSPRPTIASAPKRSACCSLGRLNFLAASAGCVYERPLPIRSRQLGALAPLDQSQPEVALANTFDAPIAASGARRPRSSPQPGQQFRRNRDRTSRRPGAPRPPKRRFRDRTSCHVRVRAHGLRRDRRTAANPPLPAAGSCRAGIASKAFSPRRSLHA
jgi:hypothetical protein